jgi:UDP-N-acetyl-D-glucosamine dehydrogenase
MPEYVLDLVADALNDQSKPLRGSRVLVLGVTYKRDVADVRESPAIDIVSLLLSKGAQADFHDPYVKSLEISERDRAEVISSIELTEPALGEYDAVVIVADHSAYDYAWIADHARLVVDTRNATRHLKGRDNIRRL